MQRILSHLTIFFSAIVIALFGIFSFNSTPIADDYCYALTATSGRIIENTLYLSQNWSFLPIGYLIQNLVWVTSDDGIMASLYLTGFVFVFFISCIVVFTRKTLLTKKNKVTIIFLAMFFSSIALSRTGAIYKYSSVAEVKVAKLPIEILTSLPDGRMGYWYFNAPLISSRTVVIAMIIIGALILSKNSKRMSFLWIFFAILISLLTHSEALYVGGALLIYLMIALVRKIKVSLVLVACASILLLTPIIQTFTNGSKFRQDQLPDFTITQVVLRTISVFIYLFMTIYMLNTLVLATVAAILIRKLNNQVDYEKAKILRNIFLLLAISSFLVESLTTALSYVAEYHWTTLHAFSFLAQFFAVLFHSQRKSVTQKSEIFLKSLSLMLLVSSITLTAQNIELSKLRLEAWKVRSLDSLASDSNQRVSIPRYDLRNSILVEDLELDHKTIVPGRGYMSAGTYECFKKLPVGW
jgi:hypothetical protein